MKRRLLQGNQWALALRGRQGDANFLADGTLPLQGFHLISPPPGRMIADPFPFVWKGQTFVFVEEALFRPKKGVIAYFQLDSEGRPGPLIQVLERPYHLSYPFVFGWQGNVYMIPESCGNRSIELYKAVDFPTRWQLEHTLFKDVDAVDATLLEHDGRFWMFVNMASADGSYCRQLHLYFAPSPFGPWTAHPGNPIIASLKRSRPAGRIFKWNGSFIRPSQDCSTTYGGAINFCRIEALSCDRYQETVIARAEPPLFKGNTGIHTYNFTRQFEIIDCKETRSRLTMAAGLLLALSRRAKVHRLKTIALSHDLHVQQGQG